MKKGDIVKLVNHSVKRLLWSAYSVESYNYARGLDKEQIPTEFVIQHSTPGVYCGGRDASLIFEGIPGLFNAKYFEVLLQAGEPDVDQLLRESEEQVLVNYAMYV